ncbi:xanthine dehydrogenase family protein molybdopterin-binding subunit [Pseudooceanicola sediminis]|uniref:Xanthine dehydrogenase family protein molybdopterin-binding subunit n=2 Tax=Pseudooceanicola sediminis TaxID=2211117 RepID=A0A399J2G6_9RHOB|nr:xanthine dehydrogenase family protein molybdopterin-binding subunit [Puniceibacterium sp. HSS470]RII39535.1 xanthine dehydrogenase family protein molybdopterin-binding subunit [Pseudooceanicola sediminis]
MTRRGFLVSMTAAGVAFGFPRPSVAAMDPAAADGVPITPDGAAFEPTLWYWIDGDGRVNVNITRAEMGQHVGTAIARILADELEVAWESVHITHVDTAEKWGTMVTGGSWSVWQSWPVYRQAGAAGRTALIEAAAQKWGVEASACSVRDGVVSNGGNSISYAELVAGGLERSFTEDELKALPLKPHSQLRLVGQDVTALDIANKTDGKTIYGLDAKVEGMVYGVPLLPPTRLGASVSSVDDSGARDVKGYLQTLTLDDPSGTVPGWVVVLGETLMAAKWASERIEVDWSAGDTAAVTEADINDRSRALIADETVGAILPTQTPDTTGAFEGAADILEAEYVTQTVLHFQLEPLNATVFRNDDGIWEIHTGNQWQSLILPTLSSALDVPADKIVMRTYMLGGGFGRRLNGDYTVPAALASKALDGKPVKLVFFREDDAQFDSPRSPSVQKLRMAFDADNGVVGMEHHAAAGWPTGVMVPSFMPKGVNDEPYDPFAIDGADHWYSVGAHRVRAISNDLANKTFRPGWLRSVGPGWTNFAVESFMDEAALKLGADPLEFRLRHLKAEGQNAGSAPNAVGGASRQANVLERVAQMSGYGTADLPADTAIGIATTFGQSRTMPTWTAGAVQVRVDRETGRIEVQKIWLAFDCGTVVDPDSALAQCEGAALWGLSMALYEGTTFEDGNVSDVNLGTYTPLRMIDTPPMEIAFVDSTEVPVGLGEPGTTVIAPAIANAIHSAVGVRLRQLPIRPADVLSALKG